MPRLKDLSGQTFGSLTVLYRHGRGWRVRCICGNEYTAICSDYPSRSRSGRPPRCRRCSQADPELKAARKKWNDKGFAVRSRDA